MDDLDCYTPHSGWHFLIHSNDTGLQGYRCGFLATLIHPNESFELKKKNERMHKDEKKLAKLRTCDCAMAE